MSLKSTPTKNLSDKFRTWIEIDAKAVEHNYRVFRSWIGKTTKLWSVIKSNAYGHGLLTFPHILAQAGIDGFCVDSVVEAFALRREGIKQSIFVLGYTLPLHFVEAAKQDITITVSTFESLAVLAKYKSEIPNFHLKIDTGMHRQGFYPADIEKVTKIIKSSLVLSSHLKGAYTHFAAGKDITYPGYTEMQFAEFKIAKSALESAGFKNLIFHASASAGTMVDKKYHLDVVRVGMALYGIFPSKELEIQKPEFNLKPILSWRAVVSEVKPIKKGEYIGYDCAERILHNGMLAIVPVGYWHGFPRSLSHIGEVLIKGKRAKVMGRVSMDLLIVDVTSMKGIHVGDVATLIGKDGKDEISANEIAAKMGTSPYEALTRLNPLIERVSV